MTAIFAYAHNEVAFVAGDTLRVDRNLVRRLVSICARAAEGCDYVVLLDEALSGSRLIKLVDALLKRIGPSRFVPIAMLFEDSERPDLKRSPNRDRLVRKLEEQSRKIGLPSPVSEFPTQRTFQVDANGLCRWQSPVIWGDSDLIAGKRKVNLIFELMDHGLGILKDLAADQSEFRPYLVAAWSQNTRGQGYDFASGTMQRSFHRIVEALPWQSFRDCLWALAKERYPQDYIGAPPTAQSDFDADERWTWFGRCFREEAAKRIGEQQAGFAWMALDASLAASFPNRKPQARRDLDASPYTLPFNSTVSALNSRLLDKLVEVACKKLPLA